MNLTWGQMHERNWALMKTRFNEGTMIRNECIPCPGWPYQFILAGALAAEPQASAAAGSAPEPKAMPKSAFARPQRPMPTPTPEPPQRPIVVMTLGVQLCLRWFGEGQQIAPPEVVRRLDSQAQRHGRGGGRGPLIDESDLEATVAEMLRATQRPHGTVIVVDSMGFKSDRKDAHHVGTYYQNLHDIVEHSCFEPVWQGLITKLRLELLNDAAASVPINVVFYCKSGKRRSVGLAWLLTQKPLQAQLQRQLVARNASVLAHRVVPRVRCVCFGLA